MTHPTFDEKSEKLDRKLEQLVIQFQEDLSHLYNQIIDQSDQLQIVNNIGQTLLSTLDDREILRKLMQQLIARFHVERASFWIIDYANNSLQFQFSLNQEGRESEISDILRSIPAPQIGQGIVGKVAETGQPIIENNMPANPQVYHLIDEKSGLGKNKTTLSVPLKQDQKNIGVIQLFNKVGPEGFSEAERDLLLAITPWLAIALKHAERYHKIRVINDIGRKLISTIDYREVLRQLMKELIHYFQVERGSFWLVNHHTQQVIFQFSLNKHGNEDEISNVLRQIPTLHIGEGIVGTTAKIGEPIIENDLRANPHTLRDVDEQSGLPENRNMLSVPLKRNQKTIGVIQILNRIDARPFTHDDLNLMMLITPWVAQALENASLYEQALQDIKDAHQKRLDSELDARAASTTRIMAHHIKNDLGSARMWLNYIAESVTMLPEQQEMINKVDASMKRSIAITRALFNPYRRGELVAISPKKLIEEAINRIKTNPKIQVVNNVSELPLVEVEKNYAIDFFLELLNNAAKAIERRLKIGDIQIGYIRLTSQVKNDMIELRISNNGPSIPKEKWEIIFDQFTDPAENNERSSFGLGLWGARTFFRRQRGNIVVEQSNSQETTFMVTMVIHKEDETQQ